MKYPTKQEREATRLVREVQAEVRPSIRVLIKGRGKQRDLIQTVTQVYAGGTKVRTQGGDVWVVREINRGGIKYEAVR